jgi:hypothetical protein
MEQPYLNEDNDPRDSKMKKLFFGTNWKIPEVKKSRRTQRGDLIEEFMRNINPSRVEQKMKPLAYGYFAKVFADKSDHLLFAFLQECKKSKIGFGKHYWTQIKKANELKKAKKEAKDV